MKLEHEVKSEEAPVDDCSLAPTVLDVGSQTCKDEPQDSKEDAMPSAQVFSQSVPSLSPVSSVGFQEFNTSAWPNSRLSRGQSLCCLQRIHAFKAIRMSGPLTLVFPAFISWTPRLRCSWLFSSHPFDVSFFPIQRHPDCPLHAENLVSRLMF